MKEVLEPTRKRATRLRSVPANLKLSRRFKLELLDAVPRALAGGVELLDTLHDRRTGYFFATNLLGVQNDGKVADNGRTVDELWDAEWRCAAQRHDDRWIAEFEIPFEVLRPSHTRMCYQSAHSATRRGPASFHLRQLEAIG